MNVRYQREMNRNYMIIRAPETEEKHSFECRMLSENAIRGLLGFHEGISENGLEYYYEITSCQPLSRIMEGRKLKAADIRQIVTGILDTVSSLDEFLLCADQLLLEAEYIYTDPDRMDVKLCLLPGYSRSAPEAVSALLRNILEHTDHQDAEGIMIAYNLYEKSLRDNYGAKDLLSCLGGDDRIFPDGAENPADDDNDGRRDKTDGGCQHAHNAVNMEADIRSRVDSDGARCRLRYGNHVQEIVLGEPMGPFSEL